MCEGIEPSRFARSIALSGYPGQPEFHTIQVLPGLEPRLLDSKSSVLTNYTTEPCLREWKLGEIMTNNSRFSSCINVIIKFIQKSTSYLGLNTMTKWYPFIPNCLRQLIFSSSWVRTSDLSVNSRALCQLSYRGFRANALSSIMKMSAVGLEPTTTRLKVLRSTKLS